MGSKNLGDSTLGAQNMAIWLQNPALNPLLFFWSQSSKWFLLHPRHPCRDLQNMLLSFTQQGTSLDSCKPTIGFAQSCEHLSCDFLSSCWGRVKAPRPTPSPTVSILAIFFLTRPHLEDLQSPESFARSAQNFVRITGLWGAWSGEGACLWKGNLYSQRCYQ